jgi:dTDP-L-rhamnose 4-epimerase
VSQPRALVTGGAGFIGSHLVDGLRSDGYEVVVLDSLVPQVHGAGADRPTYLDPDVELVIGDVRDRGVVGQLLQRVDVVLHEAAAVGVGQSMYDVVDYVEANCVGTAVLCELLARGEHDVRKVLVASSMSNYGEGRYRCAAHGDRSPLPRPMSQLDERKWELLCEDCGAEMVPVPTDEAKPLRPTSVYATTKRDQEELVLNVCGAYGIPAVAFRYFNVYGPRQALSNPYTGVAAIFSSRILNGQAPLVFEDGRQSRDFTHVADIVQANLAALRRPDADGRVVNVGTGRSTSLLELVTLLTRHLGRDDVEAEIVSQFREGDIRHCFADITLARQLLGYEPTFALEDGVEDLVAWARDERPIDRVGEALAELEAHRLVR